MNERLALTEKYRPLRVADFIGLEKPKALLRAFCRRPYASAWLFIGPPGTGKTAMGLALAAELGAELRHIPSQECVVENIRAALQELRFRPLKGAFHAVLADEADAMSDAAQLAFLSALDGTRPLAPTIFVFTCNGTGRFERRFLSRCRALEFSSYGMRPKLERFLAEVWKKETGLDGGPDFGRIAKESRTNVRDALNRLEMEILRRSAADR